MVARGHLRLSYPPNPPQPENGGRNRQDMSIPTPVFLRGGVLSGERHTVGGRT